MPPRLTLFGSAGAIYGFSKIEFRDLRALSRKLLPILLISGDHDLSKIVAVDVKSNNVPAVRMLIGRTVTAAKAARAAIVLLSRRKFSAEYEAFSVIWLFINAYRKLIPII